ncbi:MAG TPA: leucyl/phenylalanyl-tRNA--protein transferase [Alphaproteobacteria bacterium]|nr:leucyl/phenylalanyl-tRNA--protein transferase [Alphaproteobacteria bacterium]
MTTLTPELLLRAYAAGIFPMADSRASRHLYWLDPEWRGILPLERFHVPRRLRKTVQQKRFEVRVDSAFREVISRCAEPHEGRPESWINPDIEHLYAALHEMGTAHSVECWRKGELVGGLYGVALGAAFFGESMFSRVQDASKVALVHLAARLAHGGFTLLDTQFVTKHLQQFGAIEIARAEYRKRLAAALRRVAAFQPDLPEEALFGFLQSTTQRS